MICSYLLHIRWSDTVKEALDFYADARTKDKKVCVFYRLEAKCTWYTTRTHVYNSLFPVVSIILTHSQPKYICFTTANTCTCIVQQVHVHVVVY